MLSPQEQRQKVEPQTPIMAGRETDLDRDDTAKLSSGWMTEWEEMLRSSMLILL